MYLPDFDKVQQSDRSPSLLSVCLEPTNRCPGGCPYCLIEGHFSDPSTDKIKNTLLRLRSIGVYRVGWGGGEPLLRKDIFDLGRYTKQLGMGSILRTSGMFGIETTSSARSFDWIDYSLDSVDPLIFGKCRPGVPLQTLLDNITRTSISNRVRVSILITSFNKNSILETLDWLRNTRIGAIRLQTLVHRGRAKRNWNDLKTDLDQTIQNCISYLDGSSIDCYELKTISSNTLLILKPNGSLCTSTAGGLCSIGHISDDSAVKKSIDLVGNAQVESYGIT